MLKQGVTALMAALIAVVVVHLTSDRVGVPVGAQDYYMEDALEFASDAMPGFGVIDFDGSDGWCNWGDLGAWSQVGTMAGRFPLGVPPGGTPGATVGTALANRETRRGGSAAGMARGSLPSLSFSAGTRPSASLTFNRGTLPSSSLTFSPGTLPSASFSLSRGTAPSASLSFSRGSFPSISYTRPTATFAGSRTTTESNSRNHTHNYDDAVRNRSGRFTALTTAEGGHGSSGSSTNTERTSKGHSQTHTHRFRPSGTVTLAGGGASLSGGSLPSASLRFSPGTRPSATFSFSAGTRPSASLTFNRGTLPSATFSFSSGTSPSATFAAGSLPSYTDQPVPAPYTQVAFCQPT